MKFNMCRQPPDQGQTGESWLHNTEQYGDQWGSVLQSETEAAAQPPEMEETQHEGHHKTQISGFCSKVLNQDVQTPWWGCKSSCFLDSVNSFGASFPFKHLPALN